jgi:hypothetical protein
MLGEWQAIMAGTRRMTQDMEVMVEVMVEVMAEGMTMLKPKMKMNKR